MLTHLRVRNLGVLEDASIEPAPGFTVITGETGAGKTLLLGALRLLAGEKARSGSVGPFGDETLSEGLFESGEDEFGVTRVVPREGKSRAYLDGNLVSAGALGERMGNLVEIVGQHDQLLLRRAASILRTLDESLDAPGVEVRQGYEKAWSAYREALDDQRRLGGDRMALERELDLVRYQAEEIAAAGLGSGDDERLETMSARLKNAELIREQLGGAIGDLESLVEAAGMAVSRLRRVEAVDGSAAAPRAGAETLSDVAQDLLHEVRDLLESVDADPGALEELEQKLTRLGELKRKYGRTLAEVLEFGEEAAARARDLEGLLDKAAGIEALVEEQRAEVLKLGKSLRKARERAAHQIEADASEHLAALGLAAASLRFSMAPSDPGPSGADRVELRFASDQRLEAGTIQEVASGGELSRLVLALRLATRERDVDTLVFDEVDAGVGGATALALGRKLADLAKTTQVLCVTHLPQVAAHADTHYVIERDDARASVRRVVDEDRLTELSRMLAGLPDSQSGRDAAAELLEGARP